MYIYMSIYVYKYICLIMQYLSLIRSKKKKKIISNQLRVGNRQNGMKCYWGEGGSKSKAENT